MDTKQRKRRQRVHLTLIYSMMVLTVLFTVVIFAYAIQGYRLNWSSGKVVQGGLVQFDTHLVSLLSRLASAILPSSVRAITIGTRRWM